jgi:hypothetical protein
MLAGWPSGQARGIGAAGDDRPVLFRGPAAGAADWFWRGECAWTTPVVVLDDSEHTAGETDGIEGDRLAARLDGGRPVVPPAPRVGPAEPAPTKEDGTDG